MGRPGRARAAARRPPARGGAVRDRGGPGFCANAVWYGYRGHCGIKRRLVRLVGWGAEVADPVLRSPAAYDVAYRELYDPLPPCRSCACLVVPAA